jgi:hypothetical protein
MTAMYSRPNRPLGLRPEPPSARGRRHQLAPAARSNLRFTDRRVAQLEAQLTEQATAAP